jgi:hypothetical protein
VDELFENENLVVDKHMIVRIYAEISQKNLNELLKKKEKKIKVKDPFIFIKDGVIYLKGYVTASFLRAKIKSRGKFYISEDGKEINFYSDYIALSGIKLPQFLLVKVIKKMNPVLDLKSFAFDITLKKIIMQNGKMIISSFNKMPDIKSLCEK